MNRLKKSVPRWLTAGWALRLASGLTFLCICWGNGYEAVAATRFISYLYVEANEGDSSGGHTAIRFEKQTFHFQHEKSGIIRISRLDSTVFDHLYAILGNRTIRESWIAVSEETYAMLLDSFVQLFFIQDRQLQTLDTLHQDVALFELLLELTQARNSGAARSALPLKGVGYFLPDGAIHPATATNFGSDTIITAQPSSPVLRKLRERIRISYGEHFIEKRTSQAKSSLRKIRLQAASPHLTALSRDIYPTVTPYASTTYNDALLALFALELLQSAPELRPGSVWSPANDPFRLTPAEKLSLRSFAERLENDLVRLVDSPRNDWGFPFIAGMARLSSLEASLSSERLVLLNLFPDEKKLHGRQPLTRLRYLPAMRNEVEEEFLKRKKEFFEQSEMRESAYASLELAGNRLIDLEQSLANSTEPRGHLETPLPARPAWRSDLPLPDMDEAVLQRELDRARTAAKEYSQAFSRIYAYNLVRRNCVTEIFTTINNSLTQLPLTTGQPMATRTMAPPSRAKEESLQRLGGFVDAAQGLGFIPFISADKVNTCYSVVARHERPSYRAEQLAEMKKREAALLVFLRESNTLTSTIYRPAPEDSPFLFFTDDTILLRPVFGAFNLLVGLGESLIGLVTMPVDGTKRLQLGAKGVLFSLPELAFVNIRKGSMEYVAESR